VTDALLLSETEPPPQHGGEQEDGEYGLVHDTEQGIAVDGEADGPVHGDVRENDDEVQDDARSLLKQEDTGPSADRGRPLGRCP